MEKELIKQFEKLNEDAKGKLIDFLKAINGEAMAPQTPEEREAEKAFRKTMQRWDKVARGEVRG